VDVSDVLREMDDVVNRGVWPGDDGAGAHVRRWLAVLRPVLAKLAELEERRGEALYEQWNREEREVNPSVERFPLKSGLPQRLLRDLELVTTFRADHEGTGEVEFNYARVPPEHRLQALLSVMGCLGDRIELALGAEAYLNLLRGVLARRER
jgi:hypothetical protein